MADERLLREKLGGTYSRLEKLKNPAVNDFIEKYIRHCNPASVFVCDNSREDAEYIRRRAVEGHEEYRLRIPGHTVHFDGFRDQARDKDNTKFLLQEGVTLGELNSIDRERGLAEVHEVLRGIMAGREMLVLFFTLGPLDSVFSLPCVQLTDSYYVAHSEMLLYRPGYEQFRKKKPKDFFRFIHSSGEVENGISVNVDKRRVYIDLQEETVYSANTQYGGNTIGLKKLAMRPAIKRACEQGWLTEHMFLMGVHGPNGRVTYLAGAFPSACGKTSTSMVLGETIVGDDIAYFRVIDGRVRAVNVEKGLFGIINDVNSRDDPVIYKALTTPRDLIVSNVLLYGDGSVYWNGKDGECPDKGRNHSGEWFKGKKNEKGKDIPPSHKNARYTISIGELDNVDARVDDPAGVEVGGLIYGGRDSDTTVPVEEAFGWEHGILTKAATIESETTAATLGQEGVRAFNPMSNLDFLSVPLGRYIQCNLDFGGRVRKPPLIFSVNYFIKDKSGNYLTSKEDKRVWLKWMELRAHGGVGALKTPTGYIPRYEDSKRLFKEVLGREYSKEDYNRQFTIRTLELLAKTDRIEVIYREKVSDTPEILFKALDEQRKRIERAREKHGDYILPEQLEQ